MSTGISHFSICSLPPVRTRLHNVLPYAHGPSPSCAHRAGFWGFEQAAAPPVRGFPGFASLALPGANPQSKNPFRVHPFTCMPSKPESA